MCRDLKCCLLALAAAILFTAGGTTLTRSAEGEQTPTADVPLEIPKDWKEHRNPRPADEQSVSNGKTLFSSQCVMCHGASGDGSGALAARLKFKMPDFTEPNKRADGELFYILTHGHGKMPGEGDRLSDETKWDLVNYIRSLPADE
jgi:mono/diheme cytochrome c family protein